MQNSWTYMKENIFLQCSYEKPQFPFRKIPRIPAIHALLTMSNNATTNRTRKKGYQIKSAKNQISLTLASNGHIMLTERRTWENQIRYEQDFSIFVLSESSMSRMCVCVFFKAFEVRLGNCYEMLAIFLPHRQLLGDSFFSKGVSNSFVTHVRKATTLRHTNPNTTQNDL